jgi:pimeloyl-ACP methyl ester carboxylesterase
MLAHPDWALKTLRVRNFFTHGLQSTMELMPPSAVPESNYFITKHVFYGGAEQDYVCVAASQVSNLEKFCPNRTVHLYGGDHWIIWSHAEEINNDLAEWLKQLEKPKL